MLVCVLSLGLVLSLARLQKQAATVVLSGSGLLEVFFSQAGNSKDTAFQNAVSPVCLQQDARVTI